jgi:hypothetical protein
LSLGLKHHMGSAPAMQNKDQSPQVIHSREDPGVNDHYQPTTSQLLSSYKMFWGLDDKRHWTCTKLGVRRFDFLRQGLKHTTHDSNALPSTHGDWQSC